jgi:uncharacterized protein YutE (UPF0331/DUF86 family)
MASCAPPLNANSKSLARPSASRCSIGLMLATKITDVPAIIAFRNQLTHAYSAVDHRTVWGLLERRVPQLR